MSNVVHTPKASLRRKSGAPENFLTVNDDDAEKENLRQNVKEEVSNFTPFKSILSSESVAKRQSFDAPGAKIFGTPKGGKLDSDRLQNLYGDCIKLANENKITQKNAWSMNLLDHIRGLAESAETDFVTAGCTLDAAGKIYSCRVDSVHNETFRVVTGLSRSSQNEGKEQEQEPKDADGQDGDSEGEEGEGDGKRRKGKKVQGKGSVTLEANPEQLTLKKVETEYTVDPLFHSLCLAFDEGGARGLVLNQLRLSRHCKVLIDSADTQDDDAAGEATGESEGDAAKGPAPAGPEGVVDVSELQAGLWGALGVESREAFEGKLRALNVCDATVSFLGCDTDALPLPPVAPSSADLAALHLPLPAQEEDVEAAEGGADDDDDDGVNDEEFEMGAGLAAEAALSEELHDDAAPDGGGGLPMQAEMQRLRAADGGGRAGSGGGVEELEALLAISNDDYSYFGAEGVKGWAGPSHWLGRGRKAPKPAEGADGAEGKGGRGGKKEAFLLDLKGPEPKDMGSLLSSSKASTVLASKGASLASLRAANTLPPDHKFAPHKLARLFLRPNTKVSCIFRAQGSAEDGHDDCPAEAEWCMQEAGGSDDEGGDGGEDAGDEVFGGGAGVAMLAAPRRAEKIEIDYARTAKKIDIKGLKESLWGGLADMRGPDGEEGADGSVRVEVEGREAEARAFSDSIAAVPVQQFPEVSVPFCFICLLHLANEKSLSLLGSGQRRDAAGGSLCAGDLSDLLIVHDP